MGQYHYTVNLDKREYINPHKLGDGLKLVEQCGYAPGGTNDALHLLLACSNGRGGGDFPEEADPKGKWVGRWAGDRIAVVGDYAEDRDLAPEHHAKSIYGLCSKPEDFEGEECPKNLYTDITDELIPVLEIAYEIAYWGEGWRERGALRDVINFGEKAKLEYTHRVEAGRVAYITTQQANGKVQGKNYLVADLTTALAKWRKTHTHGKPTFADLKLKAARDKDA